MKSLIKITLIVSLLGFLFFNSNCKKNLSLDYSGTVYDSLHGKNKKPVANVNIILYTCDKTPENGLICNGAQTKIAEGTTDAHGNFSIQKTAKQRGNWDVIYISVTGAPYSQATGYYKKDLPTELYMNF
jgi:hypothetical protein